MLRLLCFILLIQFGLPAQIKVSAPSVPSVAEIEEDDEDTGVKLA